MAVETRKIQVPASEVRSDVREELEKLASRIETAREPSFLEILLPHDRDLYMFTAASLAAYMSRCVWALGESLQEILRRNESIIHETVRRSLEGLGELEDLEPDDLLFVLNREFLRGVEEAEEAMQDREAARERGDLIPLDKLKAELGLD